MNPILEKRKMTETKTQNGGAAKGRARRAGRGRHSRGRRELFDILRLREVPRGKGRVDGAQAREGDGDNRAQRLRKEHLSSLHKPHERPRGRLHDFRPSGARRRGHLPPAPRRRGAAPGGLAWCSSAPTRSRRAYTTMSPTARGSRAASGGRSSTGLSRLPCAARRSGTRLRSGSRITRSECRAASSRGCASRALWQCAPKCCLWTNRAAPSTLSRPSRIEDLIGELSGEYTIAIVTHNSTLSAVQSNSHNRSVFYFPPAITPEELIIVQVLFRSYSVLL